MWMSGHQQEATAEPKAACEARQSKPARAQYGVNGDDEPDPRICRNSSATVALARQSGAK